MNTIDPENNLSIEDEDELPLVLVVDDDEICQQFIIKQLHEEKLLVKTKTAVNVNEALDLIKEQIAKEQNFDVIFLDMYLKDNQHGIELLKIIRENGWLKEALIIVMSGTEDSNIVEKCYEYKIQNFLRKPITRINFKNEMIKVKKTFLEQLVCPIPAYKYLRFLGEGQNGKVVLVREKKTKMKYAMKTIKIQNNDTGMSKELEEREYLRGINSPTVIKLKEFNHIDNTLYLIIEFAENGTLSDVIKSHTQKKELISEDIILNWMTEICLGLYHIHEMNVIHRDIKSENLFLCKNQVAKIGDLGAARALGEGARAATMIGTTYYMSPEVMQNKEYNNKVDIWSAGVVFYELLTNTLPFKGYDAEQIKKKVTTLEYNLDLLKNRNPELVNLLKNMLVLDAKDRFSAKQCLQNRLINERLHLLINDKTLEMDDEVKQKIMKIVPSKEIARPIAGDVETAKLQEYYGDIETLMKIEFSAIKSVYNPGFFKSKITDVISGSDFDSALTEFNLSTKQVELLLEKNYIRNILTPDNFEFDGSNKVYYKVNLQEFPNIDNIIKYPFEQPKEDPVALSISCINKAEALWKLANEVFDNEPDETNCKIKTTSSKQYIDFLIEIRKLKDINIQKLTKEKKLATMLNIYMTMFRHFQVKSLVFNQTPETGIVDSIMSLVFKSRNRLDIVYNIAGQVISLYEMKHIVIRRNKKPFEHYFFKLASGSDPRINFIQETNNSVLERLLLICVDPCDNMDDYTLNLSFFDDNKVSEQIETRCIAFFADNIKVEQSQILIPKFLNHYLADFNGQIGDFIKFLWKFNKDPEVKLNNTIKGITDGKIQVNWY